MPILESDVRFRASQRMTDFPDGGGLMSTVTVVDGVDNNLFDDITDLQRLFGHLSLRKVYGAVLSNNSDTYISAHALVDVPPVDSATGCFVFATGGLSTERAAAEGAVLATNRVHGIATLPAGLSAGATTIAVPLFGRWARVQAGASPLSDGSVGAPTFAPMTRQIAFAFIGAMFSTATVFTAGAWAQTPGSGFGNIWQNDNLLMTYAGQAVVPGSLSGSYTRPGIGVVTFTDTPILSLFPGTAQLQHRTQIIPSPADAGTDLINARAPYSYRAISFAAGVDRADEQVSAPGALTYRAMRQVGTIASSFYFEAASSAVTLTLPTNLSMGTLVAESTNIGFPYYAAAPTQLDNGLLYASNSLTVRGSLNRATGALTLSGLNPGTVYRVSFGTTSDVAEIPFSDLSNSGTVTAGILTLTLGAGYSAASIGFVCNSKPYVMDAAQLVAEVDALGFSVVTVGSVNVATGVMTLPGLAGQTITSWQAFKTRASRVRSLAFQLQPVEQTVSPITLSGTTSAGTPFSLSLPASGSVTSGAVTANVFQSTYVSVSFSVDANPLLNLNYTIETPGVVTPPSTAGHKPTFGVGDAVLIHSTIAPAAAAVSNGSTTATGRTNLSRLRVIGNNGVVHASFVLNQPAPTGVGCTADLTAGTVTFTDVSGMSQPVRVEHRIEEMSVVSSIAGDTLTLSRALSRAYPAGTRVSSLLMLGDLKARVGVTFAQTAWTGVFADAVLGGSPAADYDTAGNPIVVTNRGAVNERWYALFTNTTTFRLIGEQLGEIGTFGTGSACAPNNPATGVPYFSIPAVGWGSGWAAGNVFRFNTAGANAPIWVGRSVAPSTPAGDDSVTLQLRGYTNT